LKLLYVICLIDNLIMRFSSFQLVLSKPFPRSSPTYQFVLELLSRKSFSIVALQLIFGCGIRHYTSLWFGRAGPSPAIVVRRTPHSSHTPGYRAESGLSPTDRPKLDIQLMDGGRIDRLSVCVTRPPTGEAGHAILPF
jgi:hypothetical protein